tara:strand:- start:38 stop:637 length:600 start_codon:yes stop_codon:yes gene_type:complete
MSFITNITSSPATTGSYTDGYPTDVDNDQGNIRAGGSIAETGSFSSNALGEGNPITTIVSGVNNYQAGAGTWNQQTQFSDIMKATTTLGGAANNAILFGASDSAQGDAIHQAATIRVRLYKTSIRAGDWNPYSGWSSAPSVVESGGYNVSAGVDNASTLKSSGTDHAANPSSARPGELTQHQGRLGEPTNLDYKPRYLW